MAQPVQICPIPRPSPPISFLDLSCNMIEAGEIHPFAHLNIQLDSMLCRAVPFYNINHYNFCVRIKTPYRVYLWNLVSSLNNCVPGTIGNNYARRNPDEAAILRMCMEFLVDDYPDKPPNATIREQWINNLTSWFAVIRELIYADIKDIYKIFQLGFITIEFAQMHTLELAKSDTGNTVNLLYSNTNLQYTLQIQSLQPSNIIADIAVIMGYTVEQLLQMYRVQGLGTRGKRKQGDDCPFGTYNVLPVDNCTHGCGAVIGPTIAPVLCNKCSRITNRSIWKYHGQTYKLKKRDDGYTLNNSVPWSVSQPQQYSYDLLNDQNPVPYPRFMDPDKSYDTPSDHRARIFYTILLAIQRQTTRPTTVSNPLAQELLTFPFSVILDKQPLYGSLINLHDQIMLKRAVNTVIKYCGKLPESVSERYYSGKFDVKAMFQELKALLPPVVASPDSTLQQ
jgi:hypothetical protein